MVMVAWCNIVLVVVPVGIVVDKVPEEVGVGLVDVIAVELAIDEELTVPLPKWYSLGSIQPSVGAPILSILSYVTPFLAVVTLIGIPHRQQYRHDHCHRLHYRPFHKNNRSLGRRTVIHSRILRLHCVI